MANIVIFGIKIAVFLEHLIDSQAHFIPGSTVFHVKFLKFWENFKFNDLVYMVKMDNKLVVFEAAESISGLIFLSRSMVIDIKRPGHF